MWTLKADITRNFQNHSETYWVLWEVESSRQGLYSVHFCFFLYSLLLLDDFILYFISEYFIIYYSSMFFLELLFNRSHVGLWICILRSTPIEKTNLVFMWEAAWLKIPDHSLCPIICISGLMPSVMLYQVYNLHVYRHSLIATFFIIEKIRKIKNNLNNLNAHQ